MNKTGFCKHDFIFVGREFAISEKPDGLNPLFSCMIIKNFSIPFAVLLLSAFVACTQKRVYPAPDGYDLNNPLIIKLNSGLNEISGIAYYPKDTSVFAIIDEDGLLF